MLPKHQLIGYHAAMYNSDRFVDSFLTSFSRASRNETGRENTLPKMQDIEKMEELDDVQNIYHNAVITIGDEEED